MSETKSDYESFTIPFYVNPLNSTRGCIQMAITTAVVTKNVRMSRCWEVELVSYEIHLQSSSKFTHLMPLKPDRASVGPVCQVSLQHLVLTSKSRNFQTVHRNRPYE
jgi:hypothetical protein